jgi:hypothetical protein
MRSWVSDADRLLVPIQDAHGGVIMVRQQCGHIERMSY